MDPTDRTTRLRRNDYRRILRTLERQDVRRAARGRGRGLNTLNNRPGDNFLSRALHRRATNIQALFRGFRSRIRTTPRLLTRARRAYRAAAHRGHTVRWTWSGRNQRRWANRQTWRGW